jgi:hypothetical protein
VFESVLVLGRSNLDCVGFFNHLIMGCLRFWVVQI